MKLKTLKFCLVMAGFTAASHGALSFSENFTSGLSPNMTLGTPYNDPAVGGYTGPAATSFVGAFSITSGPGARIYLGTNATDYSVNDFTFEADVFVPNTTNPWTIISLGMGTPDAPAGVPALGNTVSIFARPDNNQLEFFDNGTLGTAKTGVPVPNNTHGVRMEWNATTKLATFLFDVGNDGTYDPALTFTVNGADNGFTASNSRLFLGGGNGLVFDNIVVSTIPEPTAALLGGLGVLALLRRRRN